MIRLFPRVSSLFADGIGKNVALPGMTVYDTLARLLCQNLKKWQELQLGIKSVEELLPNIIPFGNP